MLTRTRIKKAKARKQSFAVLLPCGCVAAAIRLDGADGMRVPAVVREWQRAGIK